MRGVVDYSLQGLLTIRLASAPDRIVRWLEASLGPSSGDAAGEPDLIVTFCRMPPPAGELRLVGLNAAAFDDSSFYVLDRMGRRARLDFARLGETTEILCDERLASIPLLVPILAIRLLRKGHVLLHASSFVHGGKAVVATGWEKGGKTELLLACMAVGADYLADEWTIVSADGTVRGLPAVPRVWGWLFRDLPEYWSRLSPADRARLRLLRLYQRGYRLVPEPKGPASLARQALHRLALEGGVPWVGQARPAPGRFFAGHVGNGPAPVERLVLASVVAGPTSARPADSGEVVSRMVASQNAERQPLLAAYERFRFAFPDVRNEFLESATDEESRVLGTALAGVPTCDLRHPYPVALDELYEAVRPFLA